VHVLIVDLTCNWIVAPSIWKRVLVALILQCGAHCYIKVVAIMSFPEFILILVTGIWPTPAGTSVNKHVNWLVFVANIGAKSHFSHVHTVSDNQLRWILAIGAPRKDILIFRFILEVWYTKEWWISLGIFLFFLSSFYPVFVGIAHCKILISILPNTSSSSLSRTTFSTISFASKSSAIVFFALFFF